MKKRVIEILYVVNKVFRYGQKKIKFDGYKGNCTRCCTWNGASTSALQKEVDVIGRPVPGRAPVTRYTMKRYYELPLGANYGTTAGALARRLRC